MFILPFLLFMMNSVNEAQVRDLIGIGDWPEFIFTTLDGTQVSNETLGDGLTVIEFRGTNVCNPFLDQFGVLEKNLSEIYTAYDEYGLEVYTAQFRIIPWDFLRVMPWDFFENSVAWEELPAPLIVIRTWPNVADNFPIPTFPYICILSPEAEVVWAGPPVLLNDDVMYGLVEKYLGADLPTYSFESVVEIKGTLEDGDLSSYGGKFFDHFEVELEAGGQYQIDLLSNDFDAYLCMSAASEDGRWFNDDHSTESTNSRILIRDADLGRYDIFVSVPDADRAGRGAYALRVRRRVVIARDEEKPALEAP